MSIFKCKMCGGTVEFEQGATVGECDSCGTKQTLPRISDDRRANLYDRANHFRRNNEFDKAAGIYEKILTDDNTDAEAYWSLVLCSYGIEYVEEPGSHKRVPTVNRAQFTSIFDDDNYKSALANADGFQREIYEKEAKAINDIQKGILAISQKEEPFDVFICYKETDNNGRRTHDSVLANDLYHQLTQEGFKVFFSRITLEDKLGSAYEPYIFAALNSAKVMVVLGTKPEHFNAVWVKNEWSRYLALVKKSGGQKVLIPAYKDMDPYDLPEEFSHLQAQDMSKLGFMQDLIRGIKKIAGSSVFASVAKVTVAASAGNASIEPLLKRAFMFLEDGSWKDADEYCERVLDQEPENGQAYLGKLLAELHVKRQEELPNCDKPFDKSGNYKKAIRFGGDKLASELEGYIAHINERNEKKRLVGIYNQAFNAMNDANNEGAFKYAASVFQSISGFKDADALYEKCLEKAEISRKDHVYSLASSSMDGSISGYEKAIEVFKSISGWKNADEQIAICRRKIEEIKQKEEADRLESERRAEEERLKFEKAVKAKARKTRFALISVAVLMCILIAAGFINQHLKYNKAMSLLDSGNYDAAYELLKNLNNYKDSYKKLEEMLPQYKKFLLMKAEVGSIILFGSYEQDNNYSNGKEPIEWIVLAKDSDNILVVSKYGLDCHRYNTEYQDVTWETCSLRKWLNSGFLNEAFSVGEQGMIKSSVVTADANPEYDTPAGNDTTDEVFLMSILEARRYFASDESRKCQPTSYAMRRGAYKDSDTGCCVFWLRSPGNRANDAACVGHNGAVDSYGGSVINDGSAVRPALRIIL